MLIFPRTLLLSLQSPVVQVGKLHSSKKNVVNTQQGPFGSEESTVSSVQDLQMASCTAVNSMMKSSVDLLLSSAAPVFAGANIGSISGCTFQIFHGNVKFVQTEKKRRLVIESDDDD